MPEITAKDILSWKNLILQLPLVAVACFAIYGNYKGVWMWASIHEQAVSRCESEKSDLRAQRDAYAWIAVRGTKFAQEQAKDQLDKTEAANKSVEVSPTEKAAVRRPVQRTDPKTLDTTLDTAQKVVKAVN